MVGIPRDPHLIGHWLLAHEAGEHLSAQGWIGAAERVHQRLRQGLTVFLGQAGFNSLWARAMHLAMQTFPTDVQVAEKDGTALLPGLRANVSGYTGAEIRDLLLDAVTSFISLLFTFVGRELGFRLILQIWPGLAPAVASDHTGEVIS